MKNLNLILMKKKASLMTKTKLLSIGIDVGSTNGAISIVDEKGKILLLTKAPIYQTLVKSKRNKSKLNRETGKYEQYENSRGSAPQKL